MMQKWNPKPVNKKPPSDGPSLTPFQPITSKRNSNSGGENNAERSLTRSPDAASNAPTKIPSTPSPAPVVAPIPAESKYVPIHEIGEAPWSESGIHSILDEFLAAYAARPDPAEHNGLKSVTLLGTWAAVRGVMPEWIILSGLTENSACVIEAALPDAKLIVLDVSFMDADFSNAEIDFSSCVLIIEDAKNSYAVAKKGAELGLKHILFCSNYPQQIGTRPLSISAILNDRQGLGDRFPTEKNFLLGMTEAFRIFPPVFDYAKPITFESTLIDEKSLLGKFDPTSHARYRIFEADMSTYRWISYMKFK